METPVTKLLKECTDVLNHHMNHGIFNAESKVNYARNYSAAALAAAIEMMMLRVSNSPGHSPGKHVSDEYRAFEEFRDAMIRWNCIPEYCTNSELFHNKFPHLKPKNLAGFYELNSYDAVGRWLNAILLQGHHYPYDLAQKL